ncbi:GDSL-type esterase/lipase family protein [Clostridium estertheticum]|uniref:GDSL-type esterase/lipase family protein n=1 Tax=Clostridium estertheticum TaxID=238834 RepID=UPI0013E9353B|nr:GDSL-type esterase/lipase family protein [Clostridium estertheticum]MBZ9687066.1 GDSL-type esterase/lipase family protein [Clostridium estertheticum]
MSSNGTKTKLNIIIGLIILISCCFFLRSFLKHKQEKKIIEANYIILQKLESADVATVEKNITEKHKLKDEKGGDNSNEISNKVYFESSVFMGDSITEGLDFYNIVNKSSVLAKKGVNLVQAKQAVSTLVSINPQRVFILYGMNDLKSFESPNDFKDNYTKLIQAIKQKVPSAEIYLQSLTPVQAKVRQENNSLSQDRIDKFVEKVIEVARQENVHYIDIRSIVKDREDLYEPDGMHFTVAFYGLWLDYLRNHLDD